MRKLFANPLEGGRDNRRNVGTMEKLLRELLWDCKHTDGGVKLKRVMHDLLGDYSYDLVQGQLIEAKLEQGDKPIEVPGAVTPEDDPKDDDVDVRPPSLRLKMDEPEDDDEPPAPPIYDKHARKGRAGSQAAPAEREQRRAMSRRGIDDLPNPAWSIITDPPKPLVKPSPKPMTGQEMFENVLAFIAMPFVIVLPVIVSVVIFFVVAHLAGC